MNQIQIQPNRPLFVSLVDPENSEAFDFELGAGRYETIAGELLVLPRPAVILLNALGVKPGEEIQVVQHWSGRPGDSRKWTVALSTRSELARADAGEPDTLTQQLERSIEAVQKQIAPVEAPTPIRKPEKRQIEEQPRLFDHRQHQPTCTANLLFDEARCNCVGPPRGTGTNGPAPQPAAIPLSIPLPATAIGRYQKPGQIPANVATREILAFIASDPGTRNWSAEARQDLASTILIAAYKAGHIGLWEREK